MKLEIMSLSHGRICLKCSLLLPFMLLLQSSRGQQGFPGTSVWLQDHLHRLGGRAVLVILKDGKIVYNHSENQLSTLQKKTLRYFAGREGKDKTEAVADFSFTRPEPVASCSKWLSAALVMTFIDEGRLHLDDTVGQFLPVLSAHGKGDITLRDCLDHLTGINGGGLKDSRDLVTQSRSMHEVIDKIARLPMEGKPGTVFHYSSIGLQIAAAVLEKISGTGFSTLFHQRIALPCDMRNTDFGTATVPLAAGGARCSARDYIHFLQMLLQNGRYDGKKVLSEESVAAMQQDDTKGVRVAYTPAQAGTYGYGLGEWILKGGNGRAAVVSSPGLFGSFPWINNEKRYAGFLLVLNLRQKDRQELYAQLVDIADQEIGN